ncbi:MAG: MFS transporter [Burkholderiales bacterium]|nr:MFS transporter [Burkholderiales bacterium]
MSLLDTRERYAPIGASRDGRATIALVLLCQVAHFLTFAAIPLLLPAMRDDLGLSFTQAGILAGAAMVSYAAGQVPAGLISDRYGPRRPYFAGLLAWSILSFGFGLVHAFWLAVAIQFVAGAFRSLLFAPGLSLLSAWFPPQRRATAMSLFHLGGAGGSVLLSLLAPPLVERHGWRATFMLFAAIGVAAAWLFVSRARDRQTEAPARSPVLPRLVQLARFPILWVCSWLQFVRFVVAMGFNFWLPSFLVDDRGFSLPAAGLVVALSAALSAPANTLGAYVSDRLRNPPLVIGGALAVLACAAAALPLAESPPLLLAAIAVYSVFLGFYFGPLFLVPVEVLGSRVAGATIGFSNLFANIGGFTCVFALGAVRDATGSFTRGFLGIAAAALAGVGLAVVLGRMRGRALAQGTAEGAPVERRAPRETG